MHAAMMGEELIVFRRIDPSQAATMAVHFQAVSVDDGSDALDAGGTQRPDQESSTDGQCNEEPGISEKNVHAAL